MKPCTYLTTNISRNVNCWMYIDYIIKVVVFEPNLFDHKIKCIYSTFYF